MSPLANLCRVWFALTALILLLVLSILTHTARLLQYIGLLSEIVREDVAVCCAALIFRFLFFVNPQNRVVKHDMKWKELAADTPALILMNHSSYFDFFFFTSVIPLSVIRSTHVRTVMSASIAKIPIVGKSIGDHAGSFKVYFQAKGAGFGTGDANDFSVDRDRQNVQTSRMEAHIEEHRGSIGFCPEGGMNKTPENGLNPFRRGSFAQAAKFGSPIWGAALSGCTDAWPRAAKIGGFPCTVAVSLKKLIVPQDGATAAELADASQVAMQAQLDELIELVGSKKAKVPAPKILL